MPILLLFVVLVGEAAAQEQTVDRVVASIGNAAITESDVLAEDRFESFLGERHAPVAWGAPDFDRVRDRLVDQKLLSKEADLEAIPAVNSSEVAGQLSEVRKRFRDESAFRTALQTLGMTEREVVEHLQEQERILRLIEQRLRPAVAVDEPDVRAYYQETFLPQVAKRSGDPPPLAEVEKHIREILEEKKMNQLLAEWLGQLRVNARVKIH